MLKNWTFYIAQLIAFLATLYVNYLANAKPINGFTSKEVSDMFTNKLVPAGFTFAVWGVIYLLLACYLIYYAIVLVKKKGDILFQFEELGLVFILTCIINSCWMLSFHHLKIGLSLVLMLGLISCLTYIFIKTQNKIQLSLWPKLAFESYFAWVNVAFVINICAFLVSIKWNGFGIEEITWAWIIFIVLVAIATFITFKYKTILYPLVISWAVYGIHSNLTETIPNDTFTTITMFVSILFVIFTAYNIIKDVFKSSMAK